jgi:hypothetical protein
MVRSVPFLIAFFFAGIDGQGVRVIEDETTAAAIIEKAKAVHPKMGMVTAALTVAFMLLPSVSRL